MLNVATTHADMWADTCTVPLIREKTHEEAPHMHTSSAFTNTAGHQWAQTHVWLSRQGEETLLSASTSQLLPRENELFHRISGRKYFENVAQRRCDLIRFIFLRLLLCSRFFASLDGSCRIHLVCSNNKRHSDLTSSRYRTYKWNKVILLFELTEHTWIDRDAGEDLLHTTHVVGKIWSETQI